MSLHLFNYFKIVKLKFEQFLFMLSHAFFGYVYAWVFHILCCFYGSVNAGCANSGFSA